jgi:hypothetical protein
MVLFGSPVGRDVLRPAACTTGTEAALEIYGHVELQVFRLRVADLDQAAPTALRPPGID